MGSKSKRIDWLNHGLEFIVVVIGILLAFQLNKCSQDNTKLATTNTHLEQIIEETLINKGFFEKAIEQTSTNIEKLDSILKLVHVPNSERTINQFSLSLLNISLVYIRKNAYNSFTQSGDVRFIKDFDQKQKIIDLYEYYKWVESFNEISTKLYTDDYYPYLKNNFDLVGGKIQDKSVYNSKVFHNILGAYYRTSMNKLKKYEDCLVEINKYLEDSEG